MYSGIARAALLTAALFVAPAAARAQASPAQSAGVTIEADPALPRPFDGLNEPARSLRDSIVALARAQIGKRYVYGGESPSRGFDCSGLVQFVASMLHLDLPRTARQQARVGDAVPPDTSRLLPGDLVTFGSGKTISHIGIYVGGGRMVHASTTAGKVIETRLLRAPARGIKPWRGARRLFAESKGKAAGPGL